MELSECFFKRYSVRKYLKKEVEPRKKDAILEAARIAPTAKNLQPFRIRVVEGAEMKKLALCTKCTFGAPLAFVVCGVGECYERFYDKKKSYDVDTSIVMTYMLLQATELSLGTCWVMAFDPEKIKEVFPETKDSEPVSILLCGYPSEESEPSFRHFERKKISEILF